MVLFLTFFSGLLISPAVTVALSNPTKAHKVEVAARGIDSRPFPSGINGKKLALSKFKKATTTNNPNNTILNTVTNDCIFPAFLTPTIFIIVNIHNIELVYIIDTNGLLSAGIIAAL